MTFSTVTNRIQCINKVHDYINKHVPKLREDIERNGVQYKKDNSLFAKDKARLDALLPDCEGVQAYFITSQYVNDSVQLRVRSTYANSEPDANGTHTCAYYDRTIYLTRQNFEPLEIYDINSMEQEHKRARQMLEDAREMESEARSILYLTEGR